MQIIGNINRELEETESTLYSTYFKIQYLLVLSLFAVDVIYNKNNISLVEIFDFATLELERK